MWFLGEFLVDALLSWVIASSGWRHLGPDLVHLLSLQEPQEDSDGHRSPYSKSLTTTQPQRGINHWLETWIFIAEYIRYINFKYVSSHTCLLHDWWCWFSVKTKWRTSLPKPSMSGTCQEHQVNWRQVEWESQVLRSVLSETMVSSQNVLHMSAHATPTVSSIHV